MPQEDQSMPYNCDGFRVVWFYHEDSLSMGMHGPKKTSASMAWLTHHVKCSQSSVMLHMQYAGQHVNMLSERSSITRTKALMHSLSFARCECQDRVSFACKRRLPKYETQVSIEYAPAESTKYGSARSTKASPSLLRSKLQPLKQPRLGEQHCKDLASHGSL